MLKSIVIWVDDIRRPPKNDCKKEYLWCHSTDETISAILKFSNPNKNMILFIDLDHDAGEYFSKGGDFIKVLDWLEENHYNFPIRIHTMNPIGRENMQRIIKKNKWTEIF